MLEHALRWAAAGWDVFPLDGKVPAIAGGRGVLDATADNRQIESWWERYPNANVGGRVPSKMFVIDVDPRSGGHEGIAELILAHGPLTETFSVRSGRCDGGSHRFYLHRGGHISGKNLPKGVDLKTHSGYTVLPPSIHPETGRPYEILRNVPPAHAPSWLEILLRPSEPRRQVVQSKFQGESIIAGFNELTSWDDILLKHRWRKTRVGYLHPEATSAVSATVRDDRLYVYSPNTPFEVTTAGEPHGYSRFDAYALLNFNGDKTAALADFRETGELR